ncbi:methylmalonyl-CoA mutase family protein, partial [Oceanobacillus massiliensis]
QIIAHESGVADTIDPLGGSYYMEALTDEMEREVNVYLDRIKDLGGAVQAIEEGYMQREIHQNAYEIQKQIEKEDEVIVGLNKFKVDEEVNPDILKVDEALETGQIESLLHVRQNRDQATVDKALANLKKSARNPKINLIPNILDAVRVYASVGEICNVLREEFGEYTGV